MASELAVAATMEVAELAVQGLGLSAASAVEQAVAWLEEPRPDPEVGYLPMMPQKPHLPDWHKMDPNKA
jgi:hypothetical protein